MATRPVSGGADLLADRYRLVEVVGRGGMADVHRAHDEVLDRPVAIKLLRAVGEEDLDRHRAEVRLLAGLNHPGLVSVFDAGTTDDGCAFLVLQFVDGGTLSARIRADGPMPPADVAQLGAEVAEALAYVHASSVIHRDVKPGNVLLDRAGRPRLADFGIARLIDATRMTATGLTIGTAAYIAPEQVAGEAVTPAVDVYALGLVLIECLTGRPAYEGTSIESALARLARQPSIPHELPRPWTELLTAMTARAADERPTAHDVAQRLHTLGGGIAPTRRLTTVVDPYPSAADRPSAVPALPPRQAPRQRRADRRRGVVVALLAALAAVLIGAGATLGSGTDTPEAPPATPQVQVPPGLQDDLERLEEAVRE